ncbi:MAG: hypothetical protein ABL986_13890 [Vicinamibacterales bacterium]
MHTKHRRQYESLLRVQEFGHTRRDAFPAGSLGAQAFEDVTTAVGQLADQAGAKGGVGRVGTGAKREARSALVERLDAVTRCATLIAESTPGFDAPFHLPNPRTDRGLISAGRVFVREAERVKGRFTEHDLPATFIEQIVGLVDEFERAVRAVEARRTDQAVSRSRVEAAFESGLAAVHRLEVIVPNRFHDDAVTVALWERACRVDYSFRSKKDPASPPAASEVAA